MPPTSSPPVPQNEPGQVNGGGCCLYDPAHYATWLGQYLGPTIKRDHPNTLILVWVRAHAPKAGMRRRGRRAVGVVWCDVVWG